MLVSTKPTNNRPAGQRNKLRTYRLFKNSVYPEPYLTMNVNRHHRRAFAQFRCGIAPLRVETDRYASNQYIPVCERTCEFCHLGVVEDETHVICNCQMYTDLRATMFSEALTHEPMFSNWNDVDKFCYIFSAPEMVKVTAKTCCEILNRRRNHLFYVSHNSI